MYPKPLAKAPLRNTAWTLAAVAALVLHGLPILESLLPLERGLRDFFQEWASARNWWDGRDLYTPHRQTVPVYLRRELQPEEIEVNAHPPPAVLLVLPLARLDYATALQVWNMLGICLIGASALWIARELRVDLRPSSAAPLIVLLCSNPMRAQFDQGQLNAVLLALLTAAWYWERRGLGWASGFAVGAAAAIKVFPAYLLLYFVCRRSWRAVLGMLTGGAVLAGIGWLVFGTHDYVAYFTSVLPQVERWRLAGLNASFHGFWLRLLGPEEGRFVPLVSTPHMANLLAVASCLAATAGAAVGTYRACTEPQRSRAWAAFLTAMLLCSPITWDHYFVLLLLPWAEAWLASRVCWRQRLALGLASVGLWINPVLLWKLFYGAQGMRQTAVDPLESLTLFSIGTFSLLVLWGILAWPRPTTNSCQPAPDAPPCSHRLDPVPSHA